MSTPDTTAVQHAPVQHAPGPKIRVRRQTGHGYWVTITHTDGRREAVQSPQIYGFETPKLARESARAVLALLPKPKETR